MALDAHSFMHGFWGPTVQVLLWFVCVCVCAGLPGGQKKVLDPLKVEF